MIIVFTVMLVIWMFETLTDLLQDTAKRENPKKSNS